MKYLFLILILISNISCISTKNDEKLKEEILQSYNKNILKARDKSYRISEDVVVPVYVEGEKKKCLFTSENFIIHTDFIKTYNENQDLIIKKLTNKKQDNTHVYVLYVLIVILFIIISMTYVKQKK